MILGGKEKAEAIKIDLQNKRNTLPTQSFVAIIFFGKEYSSTTYVNHKKKYGESIGIEVKIYNEDNHADDIQSIQTLINKLNTDNDCVGMIIQLPLPDHLKPYQTQLLSSINPSKDIDGLGGIVEGLTEVGVINIVPATVKAVITLMETYGFTTYQGKTFAILGQSGIVGKPLARALINRGATVYSCNINTPQDQIKQMTKQADFIISCTGHTHLINKSYLRDDKTQIIIDVGYGHKDGKAVGDVNTDDIKDIVQAYTPVPGGVGPLTVACLFSNIYELQMQKTNIEAIFKSME